MMAEAAMVGSMVAREFEDICNSFMHFNISIVQCQDKHATRIYMTDKNTKYNMYRDVSNRDFYRLNSRFSIMVDRLIQMSCILRSRYINDQIKLPK